MFGYALFAYRVNWRIVSACVSSLPRLRGDLPKLSGLYINYGYNNYIAICLYNAVFDILRRFITMVDKIRLNTLKAIKDAFSKAIIVLFCAICYDLLSVAGCF